MSRDVEIELTEEQEAEFSKKFDELYKAFRAECKPIEDEYYAARRKAEDALAAISEKHGFAVSLGRTKYAPNSYEEIHSKEMISWLHDWYGRPVNEDYGQEYGEWWTPSTC